MPRAITKRRVGYENDLTIDTAESALKRMKVTESEKDLDMLES